jgi:EmrB/QacA subfamily drug resistance transporter
MSAPADQSLTARVLTPAGASLADPSRRATVQPRRWEPTATRHQPAGVLAVAGDGRYHPRLRLALILVSSFMVVLDFSIVNVALPSIERELGLAPDTVQWVVTGYAIAFGGLLILGGRAVDVFGGRRMLVTGLLIFSAASLAGGVAQDSLLLIGARVVQGVGAAVIAPASFSLITTSFDEGPKRTGALGLYGATASVGFVAGQVLGGLLVQFTSWRAVFLVNVPLGLIAALLTPKLLARAHRSPTTRRGLDVGGAFLITAAIVALVFAISQADVLGWPSTPILVALGLAALSAAAFLLVERHHRDPLVRADLLRVPSLRTAATLNLLLGLWNAGEMLVLSLYLQQVLGDTPLQTGLAIAPQGILGFTAGAFGARLAGRIGIQRVLILTSATATAGFLILTDLPSTGRYSPVLAAVMLVGFGTAGTAFGTMVTASRGAADRDQGVIGGVINTSRQIGAAIGAALMPAIALAVNSGGPKAGASGDKAAMLTGAVTAGLATLVAWRATRLLSQICAESRGRPAKRVSQQAGEARSRCNTMHSAAITTSPSVDAALRDARAEPASHTVSAGQGVSKVEVAGIETVRSDWNHRELLVPAQSLGRRDQSSGLVALPR